MEKDVFDEIELDDVFNEVESDRIGDRVFEEVEKELPSLVRSYVKQQTSKIKTLTPKEITDLVDAVVSNIPKPQTVEKTIQVIKPVETKIREVKTLDKEAKEEIESLKKTVKRLEKLLNDALDRPVFVPPMLPNYSSEQGTFLKAINNKLQWASASSNGGADADPFYIGDSATDGSWRFTISGSNLSVQRRESGSWVEKGSFMP